MAVSLEQARRAQGFVIEQLREFGIQAAAGLTDVDGSWMVKVNLAMPLELGQELPSEIDGVPVMLEVVGKTRALYSKP